MIVLQLEGPRTFDLRPESQLEPMTRIVAASSKLLISDDEILISIALLVGHETHVPRRKANVER